MLEWQLRKREEEEESEGVSVCVREGREGGTFNVFIFTV